MKYDIFISYRREGGKNYARTLKPELEKRGFKVFLDFDELKDGVFDKRIMDAISESPIFLVILSQGALDRCINEEDWVRQEILFANESNRHIVPVEVDKTFRGFPSNIPNEIKTVLGQHQFSQIDTETLLQESIDKLVKDRILPHIHHEEEESEAFFLNDVASSAYKKGEKLFNEEEYILAIPYFKKAAEHGITKAMCMLGDIYKNGKDVDKNCEEALKWYQKAADLGDPDAHNALGWFYYEGIGTEKNFEKAIEHFTFAAIEKGHPCAEYGLAEIYARGSGVKQDTNKANKWYTYAAEHNHPVAQYVLGNIYKKGLGVCKDYEKAVKWYRKAAEQGHKYAQNFLGNMYYYGYGVCKDYEEAVKWYRKAAEQGYDEAQYDLGNMYYNGYGVNKDYTEAIKWYKMAAEQKHAKAQEKLLSTKSELLSQEEYNRSVQNEIAKILAKMIQDKE